MSMTEAVERTGQFFEEDRVHTVFTPNAEILMAAYRDPELRSILSNADMLTADGAGVVLASRILKRRVPEKVSGVDLVREIYKAYSANGLRCFLLGAKPGVAEEAAEKITRDYPGLIITGCRNGYFTPDQDDEIVQTINETRPDLLIVGLGAPKQEKWITANRGRLKVRVCMGLGGTIDILSGKTPLAPDFFRKNGLEWLFRLCKEPKRARRMLDLPRFMARVILERFRGR